MPSPTSSEPGRSLPIHQASDRQKAGRTVGAGQRPSACDADAFSSSGPKPSWLHRLAHSSPLAMLRQHANPNTYVKPAGQHKLVRLMTVLGASFAVLVAAAGPLAYYALATRAQQLTGQEPTGSLRPLLMETAVVALVSCALGGLVFLLLKTLPLRALRNALKALRDEKIKALAQADAQLRIVFENTTDGLLLMDEQGLIRSCNPAAAAMLGQNTQVLIGQTLLGLLRPAANALDEQLQPGHRECVALGVAGTVRHLDLAVSEARIGRTRQRMALLRDVTYLTEQHRRLTRMAAFDTLTGLPNRAQFQQRLAQAMQRAKARGEQMALMFLDLDRFKTINDSLGHAVGDQLLIQVAQRLEHCLRMGHMAAGPQGASSGPNLGRRDSDRVAAALATARSVQAQASSVQGSVFRLGGDEFTVLLEGLQDPQPATAVALRILSAFSTPVQVGKEDLYASTSIGITLYPQDAIDQEGLIKQADMAMYRSKAMGRDTYHFFHEDMQVHVQQRHALEAALRHALERQEFYLMYQPKVDLRSRSITGIEALLRWDAKGQLACGPEKFIPILEETGLIVAVGHWVLLQACQQMMHWRRAGLDLGRLAVNLSARQFRHQGLLQQVAQVLQSTGLQPQWLELELTESMLLADGDETVRIMKGLKAMGVQLAIDDFGTGHSSLSYLKRFDVDTLKIDRSFVRDTPHDPEDCAIAKAVIALGHSLKLRVVAEGVENEQQVQFLRELACDEMQGYIISKPQMPQQLQAWAKEHQPQAAKSASALVDDESGLGLLTFSDPAAELADHPDLKAAVAPVANAAQVAHAAQARTQLQVA